MIMPQASTYVRVPEASGSGGDEGLLPVGVRRVAPGALGAVRLTGAPFKRNREGRVQVAAFDFDGTCIQGNSPVMLVRYLVRQRMLPPSVVARILSWAFAYKTRLPQNEAWVRGLVFRAFVGRPASEVNGFLRDFYDQVVDQRFRADAEAEMAAHEEAGHVVVCVSATFEPIIAAAMERRPIQYAIATRMKVDFQGNYTDEVDGEPIEGSEKVVALHRLCDELFGADGWELVWAYGDHHSDRAMLAAARNGYAVTPDRPLARTANAEGYDILEW